MFGLPYPDWFVCLVFAQLTAGLIYLILHCLLEDSKRDFKRRMRRNRRKEQFSKEKSPQLLQIVSEK